MENEIKECEYKAVCSAYYNRSEKCVIYYYNCPLHYLRHSFKERGLDDMFGAIVKHEDINKIRGAGL
jgi:hypothetical protein